jgi:hypothetical protein
MAKHKELKPMTVEQLRVALYRWFCGCGLPDEAADALRKLLQFHANLDSGARSLDAAKAFVPDAGTRYLLLYALNHFGWIEHGSSIDGAWLSEEGEALLAGLQREAASGHAFLDAIACVHGVDVERRESCEACEADQAARGGVDGQP